jgi:hypothetical protein
VRRELASLQRSVTSLVGLEPMLQQMAVMVKEAIAQQQQQEQQAPGSPGAAAARWVNLENLMYTANVVIGAHKDDLALPVVRELVEAAAYSVKQFSGEPPCRCPCCPAVLWNVDCGKDLLTLWHEIWWCWCVPLRACAVTNPVASPSHAPHAWSIASCMPTTAARARLTAHLPASQPTDHTLCVHPAADQSAKLSGTALTLLGGLPSWLVTQPDVLDAVLGSIAASLHSPDDKLSRNAATTINRLCKHAGLASVIATRCGQWVQGMVDTYLARGGVTRRIGAWLQPAPCISGCSLVVAADAAVQRPALQHAALGRATTAGRHMPGPRGMLAVPAR